MALPVHLCRFDALLDLIAEAVIADECEVRQPVAGERKPAALAGDSGLKDQDDADFTPKFQRP